jgi:hypothetical protein
VDAKDDPLDDSQGEEELGITVEPADTPESWRRQHLDGGLDLKRGGENAGW